MTAPTITHGHGFLTDCNEPVTDWTQGGSGDPTTLTSTSMTCLYDDVYDITGTASAADQQTSWQKAFTNISSDLYTHYVVRWKTDVSSGGLGAKVTLVFSDSTSQTIVGSSAPTVPAFSSAWAVSSGTVTAGKTIADANFYAVSDSNCGADHHVYYDFLLLCKGAFTFPTFTKAHFEMDNVYADVPIPSRIGGHTQYNCMNGPDITLDGKIDVNPTPYCSDRTYTSKATCEAAGETWFDWGTPYCEYLMLTMQEASNDPFQWFTSDLVNCKVTPRRLILDQDGTALQTWQFMLKQYSRAGGQLSTFNDLQHWGV